MATVVVVAAAAGEVVVVALVVVKASRHVKLHISQDRSDLID